MVRVLFVDDDQFILNAYQRMLRHSSFDCTFLSEPSLVWQQPGLDSIHIVIADQQMPGLTGTELLQLLAQKHPAIKRVLISGDLNLAYRHLGSVQLDATLKKPCSKAGLLQCLTQLSTDV